MSRCYCLKMLRLAPIQQHLRGLLLLAGEIRDVQQMEVGEVVQLPVGRLEEVEGVIGGVDLMHQQDVDEGREQTLKGEILTVIVICLYETGESHHLDVHGIQRRHPAEAGEERGIGARAHGHLLVVRVRVPHLLEEIHAMTDMTFLISQNTCRLFCNSLVQLFVSMLLFICQCSKDLHH